MKQSEANEGLHPLRFGLIGAGARGLVFATHITKRGDELVAAYDPDKARLQQFSRMCGVEFCEANDANAILDHRELDAIIISSPDVFHAAQLTQALASSQNVYCEKPLATDLRTQNLLAERQGGTGPSVFMSGLVLPFHLFYRKLFALAGELGRIDSVHADDLLPGAFYFRRWHRMRKYSGGLVCHEGVHTFDIVRQLVGGKAARVTAEGRLVRFGPEPRGAEVCHECALAGTCTEYFDLRADPLADLYATPTGQMGFPRDLCVFNSKKDTPDLVIANVAFDHGPLFSYSLCLTAPRRTRLFRIIGEHGMLQGDEAESTWQLTPRGGGAVTKHHVVTPSTLFGGSDDACFDSFREAVVGRCTNDTLFAGAVTANALVLAAEISMQSGGSAVRVSEGRIDAGAGGDR